jgi:hypothetical protein
MIAIVLGGLLLFLVAATPWRRLPAVGRLWGLAACLNALIFFSLPTTAATSPWRPVVGRVLAASAGLSLALLVMGLMLRRRHAAVPGAGAVWVTPLIIGALPSMFYAFFWAIGPRY